MVSYFPRKISKSNGVFKEIPSLFTKRSYFSHTRFILTGYDKDVLKEEDNE